MSHPILDNRFKDFEQNIFFCPSCAVGHLKYLKYHQYGYDDVCLENYHLYKCDTCQSRYNVSNVAHVLKTYRNEWKRM
jgi:hypothetical protein